MFYKDVNITKKHIFAEDNIFCLFKMRSYTENYLENTTFLKSRNLKRGKTGGKFSSTRSRTLKALQEKVLV